ncbi:MAG: phenylacetic acid degradation protein [Armatimonadota bacterium]|nr:phenylacetic acid degradation protein [Armatimonadota bacterium]MDR7450279.1 phenylacetic acid degradation protein [Armatimonadota bacterium]MDR7467138.1 phenylacetic acid degradation protein [Armatimonadota bacterium]MDR7493320.1 phenylacetic acid degradation protein [Armatimonadota bacterium]MDR7499328.1 phenylacetic acid degradation protein [Armatimonadota bacterium]
MPALPDLLGMAADQAARIYAVFRQDTKIDPHVHVGEVQATDAEMALVLAKEQFARRDPCVNLWVVSLRDIAATAYDDADLFEPSTDKSYRFGGSYREQQRIMRARRRESR